MLSVLYWIHMKEAVAAAPSAQTRLETSGFNFPGNSSQALNTVGGYFLCLNESIEMSKIPKVSKSFIENSFSINIPSFWRLVYSALASVRMYSIGRIFL